MLTSSKKWTCTRSVALSLLTCITVGFQDVYSWTAAEQMSGMKFLARYGYISNAAVMTAGSMKDKEIVEGLRMYQDYAGVHVTGTLDNATMGMMKLPRCGNKDVGVVKEMKALGTGGRDKRFLIHSKWEKHILTYKILNYPDCCLSPGTVDRETEEAFQFWTSVIGPDFRIERRAWDEVVDIDIKFTTGPHNDNMRFGAAGNGDRTVAHAFFPEQDMNHHIRGDIHFNILERWTSGSPHGQNYFQTAAHEIGHSLGLDHSMEHAAVMYAMVPPFQPAFQLHPDDIQGIQHLYGVIDIEPITDHVQEEPSSDFVSSRVFNFDPGHSAPNGSTTVPETTTVRPLKTPQSEVYEPSARNPNSRHWMCKSEQLRKFNNNIFKIYSKSVCFRLRPVLDK